MNSTNQLTSEQQAVVAHPTGFHARVLAVAGSGKTTTMAHRVKQLLQAGT
jgi:DNA helicase-2/ATP-dependent DNA helicase PcrA